VRLRILGGYFRSLLSPDVLGPFDRAIEALRTSGMDLATGEIAATEIIATVYVNLVLPEAAHLHRQWLDTRAGSYSPVVRARLESGRQIPAVDYFEALDARHVFQQTVDAALDGVGALVLPTLPIVAPPIGAGEIAVDPARPERLPVRTAMLKHTQLFNITGHPAISLPLPTGGMPVGLQLVGRRQETAALLSIASTVERVLSERRGQIVV
jgi:aspartyl-tRNA(Asn)/glutamyl-tRNA(Gln) amidotransferase subunit A